MNEFGRSYEGLSFAQRPRSIPWRAITIALGLILFTLLWVLVPPNVLYWLLLPPMALLLWLASHGWRRALAALHNLIHHLEQLDGGSL